MLGYYELKKSENYKKGRLKFDDQKHNAPFPSCVVVFEPVRGGEE